MNQNTKAVTFEIGDRWIETTPSGRENIYKVVALNVTPRYQHKPGKCVRMVPVKGGCCDLVMWPEDILAVDWMSPGFGLPSVRGRKGA